ncbi:efflux transporter outer membrane subunit [Xylophilus sp.]|uniref:efflux transporter outer membrane subunit n=1 Tax=Xylophilus sp. TaxID=2653893 RepID=UPI0013BAD022|nr:efflux transporter outer membrane subunit [Xylophilus sp.]KAF1047417.1 MAG: Antibiotic efflux pump outer membrane protein ArpC [Xylophilus sp.]
MPRLPSISSSLALAVLAALAGCTAVGPDYAGPPAAPVGAAFTRAQPSNDGAPLARWWTSLGDRTLDGLVERTLAANPDIASAQARLRRARAALSLEQSNRRPTASASALTARARIPPIDLAGQSIESQWISLHAVSLNASWEADLFGLHARTVEASAATAGAAEANLADAQLSLTAEAAQAYVRLRDAQTRLRLSREAQQRQERMLALTRQRFAAGTASRLDVVRLAGQLDATRAELAPLQADIDGSLDALAVLTRQPPGALDAELSGAAAVPLPPAEVPVGDPASLLRRRPDVRAAERTLAARTAQVGVAEAAKFPQLKFTGILGLGGTELSDLGRLGNYSAVLLPQLSWNFLDFGRNRARVSQAGADRDEAEAQYRGKVLAALQDAEDALSRYGRQRAAVADYARAKASADEAATLMRQRQGAGTVGTIDLLDAERQQIAAEQNLAAAVAALTGDFITLHKALGLGWSEP